jgi:RHS repeat-associated protein
VPLPEKNQGRKTLPLQIIGKERDKESCLVDFGVRKYDAELRRFMSIDPMWEKYPSLTPYQYAANNPVIMLDDNGKFGMEDHIKAFTESGIGNGTYAFLNWFYNDLIGTQTEDYHLDIKKNFKEINDVIIKAGGFNKLDPHTKGDFYTHSKYVEIWNELLKDGKVTGEIPTYENACNNPIFWSAVQAKLRTTYWHGLNANNQNDPYDHDNSSMNRNKNCDLQCDENRYYQCFWCKR